MLAATGERQGGRGLGGKSEVITEEFNQKQIVRKLSECGEELSKSCLSAEYMLSKVLCAHNTRVFIDGGLWCGERMTLSAWPHS